MAYLNLDLGFPRHPKTRRLVGLLGRGAEMLLIRLWCHCGEHHCETGALTGYSEQEIETIAEWWGEHGKAVEAMMRVGFLKREDNTFIIKDWLEHSGHLAAHKEWARASAKKRWDKHRADATRIATSIASGNAPKNGGLVSSEDSSNGGREFANGQVHAVQFAEAKRIVRLYFELTKSKYFSTKAQAERQLAQMMLDEPALDLKKLERGIVSYVAQCVTEDEKSCAPTTFFKERRWESFEEGIPVHRDTKLTTDDDLKKLGQYKNVK